jgi:hypothetical protein
LTQTDGIGEEVETGEIVEIVSIHAGWRIVISPATGHVTLLHPVAGSARVALVVADFKGIRDG